jgi:hypothetical protein
MLVDKLVILPVVKLKNVSAVAMFSHQYGRQGGSSDIIMIVIYLIVTVTESLKGARKLEGL